jgi:hypothetical protein
MSANLNNGTLRSLNRTPQQNSSSSPTPMTDSGGSVIDTIRKRMQQMKDELATAQDELHVYKTEREREKLAREQVCSLFLTELGISYSILGRRRYRWCSTSYPIG